MSELVLPRRLRHRVRVLSTILGETMAQQFGPDFLGKIEEIRLLAKSRRQNELSHDDLLSVLQLLDDQSMISVARAFNQFLNLVNIAEQAEVHAAMSSPFPDTSALEQLFDRLKAEEVDPASIADVVVKMCCELVLTAHPTEITRRTLIQKYNHIADELDHVREDIDLRADDEVNLRRLIAEVWFTDEVRTDRPSPREEAVWGYAVMEESMWHAVPQLWMGLEKLLLEHTGVQLPLTASPIKVSSWMGGDRDGNPNVTADVTNEVIRLARWMAADLYLRDINELLNQLSMSQCSEELLAFNGTWSSEPYRLLLRSLRTRLDHTREWADGVDKPGDNLILYREDIFEPLMVCYNSLQDCGMGIIADGLLKQTLIRVASFGVTLVDLDIRQSSDKHSLLLDELTQYLELGSYAGWSEKARQDFLLEELASMRPLIPDRWQPDGEAGEILKTFRLVASGRAEGISSYVISMAANPSDVLAVILLLRKCGLERSLPVVPLFETLEDLDNSAWTLERLLHIAWYTKYIQGSQQIMIGYSDSAKDAGQMAAAWAQYRAQEDLVVVARKYGVTLSLFHGRGGTVSRGGGPAREAILSQPPGSVSGTMRVTEQGEMIRFKYGSKAIALNSLDMIVSATIEATLLPPPKPRESWRNLMDNLALKASTEYRSYTRNNTEFVEYFNQSTPERELAMLALGSRPARRAAADDDKPAGIEALRAIPWVFAWTQKRLMLPAWLGTEVALTEEMMGKDAYILAEMIDEWPFFQTQLDMLEMVLCKADLEISEYYDHLLVDAEHKDMGQQLLRKVKGLIHRVNGIKKQSELLASKPQILQSLELRHPYTDPLHFLQIELISRFRRDPDNTTEAAQKALLVTIAGIAASMRNTG